MYLSLSPQYATTHQATHVNKQPTPRHPRNEFRGEGKFIDLPGMLTLADSIFLACPDLTHHSIACDTDLNIKIIKHCEFFVESLTALKVPLN